MEDAIKELLPPTAKIIVLDKPYKRLGVITVDVDGDGIFEWIVAYYWQGENYIIVLKRNCHGWYVADTIKGKGYHVTYLGAAPITNRKKSNIIVGWQVGAIWSDLSVYEWTDTGLNDLIAGNQYFSSLEVVDIKGPQGSDGLYELAIWKHDTGEAYKVDIYRWLNHTFNLALELYPQYYKKVVKYYKKLLEKKNSTTYWYYLADAQIKTGETKDALKSIDRALSFKYPYPSREELLRLKKQILKQRVFSHQLGIDFSALKSINSETQRNIKLEKAIVKEFQLNQVGGNVRYYYNNVDLNEDGKPEVFVFLVGPFVCGTGGCSGAIFKQNDGDYHLLSRFSLVRNPVIITNNKTNGYRDIIMYVAGGGIENFYAWVRYNGTTYPLNPSIQPKVETGTKVEGLAILADDLAKSSGMDIKIQNRSF